MITSTLSNLPAYKVLGPHIATAIHYIIATDFVVLPPGKYEVEGDTIFAIVNEYQTKSAADCEPESHLKYIDIQLMIDGSEQFGYVPLAGQQPTTPFLPDNDVAFYTLDHLNYITLHAGQFIIFFPSDIHQPEVMAGQPATVKKVVLKIKVQ